MRDGNTDSCNGKKPERPLFLLIDGDVLLYKAAAGVEETFVWGDDLVIPVCSITDAFDAFLRVLAAIKSNLGLPAKHARYVLCFSDARENNFRKGVWQGYKKNRAGRLGPIGVRQLKQKVLDSQTDIGTCFLRLTLEADDLIGMLATNPRYAPGHDKVIVTIDKDLKTIPDTWYFNIDKPEDGIVFVTRKEADHNFMLQTLAGDFVDGYPGIPGVGPKGAAKILEKAGGMDASIPDMWRHVVNAYRLAYGNDEGEDMALAMARCARILRHEDYDIKQGVLLWSPYKNKKGKNQ